MQSKYVRTDNSRTRTGRQSVLCNVTSVSSHHTNNTDGCLVCTVRNVVLTATICQQHRGAPQRQTVALAREGLQ